MKLRSFQGGSFVTRPKTRIGALLITLLLTGALLFSGCGTSNDLGEEFSSTTPASTATISNTETKDNLVYDFPFTPNTKANKTEYTALDWEALRKSLKETENEFYCFLKWNDCELNHNFEIAVYENSNEFGKSYYKIMDNSGFLKNGLTYFGTATSINDNTTLLENEERNSENGSGYQYTYTILDHNTGHTKEFKAKFAYPAKGYIIAYNYNDINFRSEHQLLYADGTPASDVIYGGITSDFTNDNIFLKKDRSTIILDTKTGKAREINGTVMSADNGFIVLKINGKVGVYYLLDLESELIEKIACSFSEINFATRGEADPTFVCTDDSLDTEANSALYSVEGERLSNYYDSIMYWNEGTLIEAATSKDYISQTGTLNLINKYGIEELNGIDAFSLNYVDTTKFIIFRTNGENGKYGIMDIKGNILIEPIFDTLMINKYLINGEVTNIIFVGRINGQKITVVLDNNLNELVKGNFGFFAACDKAWDLLDSTMKLTLNAD